MDLVIYMVFTLAVLICITLTILLLKERRKTSRLILTIEELEEGLDDLAEDYQELYTLIVQNDPVAAAMANHHEVNKNNGNIN